MSDQRRETVRTSPTILEFHEAAIRACPELRQAGAAILYAHFAGETGDGRYCWNWNLGNVKWFKGCGRDYIALRGVWEIVNGKRVEIPKERPGAWFQAFDSLDDGMRYFIEKKRTGRYADAWKDVERGDPEAYARTLKRRGYYTAPVETYTASMRRYFDRCMASHVFEQAIENLGRSLELPKAPAVIEFPPDIIYGKP
jgi:hypothetical protein